MFRRLSWVPAALLAQIEPPAANSGRSPPYVHIVPAGCQVAGSRRCMVILAAGAGEAPAARVWRPLRTQNVPAKMATEFWPDGILGLRNSIDDWPIRTKWSYTGASVGAVAPASAMAGAQHSVPIC